jgi:phage head maturation protease
MMLIARHSFADENFGAVLAGITRVAADHEIVARWPERFELAPAQGEGERSAAGGDAIRMTNMTVGMVEGGEAGAVITGLAVPYNHETVISEFGETFRERFAYGALERSIREAGRFPILLDHGRDPRLGRRPIAKPSWPREDPDAARFEAELLTDDPDVTNHVMPGIRRHMYGASLRFRPEVVDVQRPRRGERLELRTVRQARVRELSVTSMAAYSGTSVALVG